MDCKKCEVEMVPGVGLRELYTTGREDFFNEDNQPDDARGRTMRPSGKSNMVNVLKCPECGRSVVK